MKKVLVVLSVLTVAQNVYSVAGQSPEQELALLKKQIVALEQQIKVLEKHYSEQKMPAKSTSTHVPHHNVTGQADAEPTQMFRSHVSNVSDSESVRNKKHWKIPGTSTEMSVSGYVKLTGIKDVRGATGLAGDSSGAGRNFLVARSIGLDGTNNAPSRDFYMHLRESRLVINTDSPIDKDNLKTCIECDFLGDPTGSAIVANNYNLRLRRAYAQFGHWLIGQDWSTYSDVSTFGETVDINGPVGNSQIRQPLIRYTTDKLGDYQFHVSMENPESEFVTRNGTMASSGNSVTSTNRGYINGIKGENRIPDFVAAVSYTKPWGSVKFAGVLRENTVVREDNNKKDSLLGAFIGAAVSCKVFSNDEITSHVGYGAGCGRYFMDSMKSATYYDGEALHNQYVYHWNIGYKHQWMQEYKLRSTVVLGVLRNLNCQSLINSIKDGTISNETAHNINKHILSCHLNLMGNMNDHTKVGIEYIIGKRKTETGLSGTLHRVVFALQFNF